MSRIFRKFLTHLRSNWTNWNQISYKVSRAEGKKIYSSGPDQMSNMDDLPMYLQASHCPEFSDQMTIRIWKFEFRAKIAPNMVNSQSLVNANTIHSEGHKHTRTGRCGFLITQFTRRPNEGHTTASDVVLKVRCVRTRFRRRHGTSRCNKTFGSSSQLPQSDFIGIAVA